MNPQHKYTLVFPCPEELVELTTGVEIYHADTVENLIGKMVRKGVIDILCYPASSGFEVRIQLRSMEKPYVAYYGNFISLGHAWRESYLKALELLTSKGWILYQQVDVPPTE